MKFFKKFWGTYLTIWVMVISLEGSLSGRLTKETWYYIHKLWSTWVGLGLILVSLSAYFLWCYILSSLNSYIDNKINLAKKGFREEASNESGQKLSVILRREKAYLKKDVKDGVKEEIMSDIRNEIDREKTFVLEQIKGELSRFEELKDKMERNIGYIEFKQAQKAEKLSQPSPTVDLAQLVKVIQEHGIQIEKRGAAK